MKYFLKYIIPFWKLSLLIIFLLLISSLASLATPYALKVIIDKVFPTGTFTDLLLILFALVGIYILRISSSLLSEILYTKLGESISRDIRLEMFRCIIIKPISFFNGIKIGDVVFTFIDDVDNVQMSLSNLVLVLLSNVFTFAGILTMLFYLDVEMTIYSILFVPCLILLLKKLTPLVKESFKEARDLESDIQNYLIVILKNIRAVKSYNTLVYELNRLSNYQNKFIKKAIIFSKFKSINSNSANFIIALAPILVLIVGGKKVFENEMTLGVLIAFVQYLNRIFTPSTTIVNSYNQLVSSTVSAEKIKSFFKTLEQKANQPSENYAPTDLKIQNLYLQNISLVLDEKVILNNLTLYFEAGKTYTIMGSSGSGKSSIVNLISKLIQPTFGKIFVNDGLPIDNISNWSTYFTLIERSNQIFNESIKDNIKYGSSNLDREIDLAVSLSHLTDVINELTEKQNTVLSHMGNSLSDGQKQRISIARAIYRSAQIFIFDEATSSLDIELEKIIISNIRQCYPDCIIIIVSHRIETTLISDHIFTLNS